MKALVIATGVAIVPCALFGLGLLAMTEPGRRRAACRHPLRSLAHAMRSDDADEPFE